MCDKIPESEENWRDISGYEGVYSVSDMGRIKRITKTNVYKAGKILCSIRASAGKKRSHMRVDLYRDGKGKLLSVHVLVLEAFVGPRPGGMVCRHLNGDPEDNRLINLTWGTGSENQQDRVLHGTDSRGENSVCSKLKEGQVLEIVSDLNKGVKLKDVAQKFGVSCGAIAMIRMKRTWGHLTNSIEIVRHKNPGPSKFSLSQVQKIIDMLDSGVSVRTIAQQFDVSIPTISRIRSGKTYGGLNGQ